MWSWCICAKRYSSLIVSTVINLRRSDEGRYHSLTFLSLNEEMLYFWVCDQNRISVAVWKSIKDKISCCVIPSPTQTALWSYTPAVPINYWFLQHFSPPSLGLRLSTGNEPLTKKATFHTTALVTDNSACQDGRSCNWHVLNLHNCTQQSCCYMFGNARSHFLY